MLIYVCYKKRTVIQNLLRILGRSNGVGHVFGHLEVIVLEGYVYGFGLG